MKYYNNNKKYLCSCYTNYLLDILKVKIDRNNYRENRLSLFIDSTKSL